jgi:putative ABC transport system permease protein
MRSSRLNLSAGSSFVRHHLAGVWHDVRFAIRTLSRAPRFTFAAVAILGSALGVAAAVFSVVSGVLLEPLPYREPDRLVRILAGKGGGFLSGPELSEYRDRARSLDGVAGANRFAATGADLTGYGQPTRVAVMPVTAGYFEVLGSRAAFGRTFAPQDERKGATEIVLSGSLARRLNADPHRMVGSPINLDGRPFLIIGVTPAGFRDPFDGETDVWKPAEIGTSYGNRNLQAIGRLAPGASVRTASAELKTLTSNLAQRRPTAYRDWSVRAVGLHEDIAGGVQTLLTILLAVVALVLVLASANVANLVLARGTGRGREHAVRAALGAGRFHLCRQAAVEGAVLATAAGIAGAIVAAGIVKSIVALRPEALPRLEAVTFGWRAWLFSVGAALAVAVVSSLPGCLRAARSDPERLLRVGAATLTGAGRHRATRGSLVSLQVAIVVVVLSVAGLLVESFARLSAVELGFKASGVTTFRVGLPAARYATGADRQAFHRRLADTLAVIPGVGDVGMVSKLPASGAFHTWAFRIDGRAEVRAGEPFGLADVRCVGGRYLEALGIPLVGGRRLAETDGEGSQQVALISASMARLYWPGANPTGERVGFGEPAGWWTIVGVVGDVHHDHRATPVPVVYLPHAQIGGDRNWAMIQVMRSPVPPAVLLPQVRATVRQLDPELVVHDVATLDDVVARDIARPRFSASLMLGFGMLSLLIATAGIYAVVSYSVSERTREIGLRMAIGAGSSDIRRMLVRSTFGWTTLGVAIGLPATSAAGRVTATMLADVRPMGPTALVPAVTVLLAAAALAAYVPARRATRIDPLEALRTE